MPDNYAEIARAKANEIVDAYVDLREQLTEEFTKLLAAADQREREIREEDAKICDALEGDGDKPTDTLIGYAECAAAIRSQSSPVEETKTACP